MSIDRKKAYRRRNATESTVPKPLKVPTDFSQLVRVDGPLTLKDRLYKIMSLTPPTMRRGTYWHHLLAAYAQAANNEQSLTEALPC